MDKAINPRSVSIHCPQSSTINASRGAPATARGVAVESGDGTGVAERTVGTLVGATVGAAVACGSGAAGVTIETLFG